MADTVRTLAYVIVLIRKQWEAEKSRLVLLAALSGGAGSSSFHSALDGKWGEVAVGVVMVLVFGALFEWRWSVAMRVPGSDRSDNG